MKITEYTIPAPLSITIAVCADLHCRPFEKALSLCVDLQPDLILSPGDMMNHLTAYAATESFNAPGLTFLSRAREIAPVYYSIGNHEGGISPENKCLLTERGITVLDNDFVYAHGLCIGGLTTGLTYGAKRTNHTPPPDLAFLDRYAAADGFHLLLCHHPEYYPAFIRQTRVELTVSGHAHGGQWHLFGHDIYAPGQGLFPQYASGCHKNRLIVSRGMANTVSPIPRLGNEPEIVALRLTAV